MSSCYNKPTQLTCHVLLLYSSSQVQQRHSDAGEPEEMTPNVAYTSFVMSPRSGKQEEVEYEAVGL